MPTAYIKCSVCGENKFRNPQAYEKDKVKYSEGKEVVEGSKIILTETPFVCRNCSAKDEGTPKKKVIDINKPEEEITPVEE